ncbi:MAG: hypothetical protein GX592_11625 [Clostridiales bacterium]|nr:hypothetical protein [Clostridiales bacterium]
MKKIVSALLLLAVLLTAAAYADSVPAISNDLFADAKEALSLLSYGEFQRVSELLPFSGDAPDASEWERFADTFETLNSGTVQREVSVAFWINATWYLAVPVSKPDRGSVEAFVLSSADGETFSGYKYTTWGNVEKGYEASDYVKWNKEYVAGTPIVIGD